MKSLGYHHRLFVWSLVLALPIPAMAGQPAGSDAAAAANPTDQARLLTEQGFEALQAGRNGDAIKLFEEALQAVPGYPEAVAGLDQAKAHTRVESREPTLMEKVRAGNKIRWDRVVASYKDAEEEVRAHVLADRFEQAKEALLRARQVIEAGKEFAEPLSRYEALRGEAEALAEFVEGEERSYQERRVDEIRGEIEEKNRARVSELRLEKQRRIDQLMDQAYQLRKDRDYDAAISVLEQVVGIDPQNQQARWLIDEWQDTYAYIRQRQSFDDRQQQTQDLLSVTEEAKVPWHKNITYPKNWLEIISRPDRNV